MPWTFALFARCRQTISRGVLILLAATLLFVQPVDAETSTNNNACYAAANGIYFSASVRVTGDAAPSGNVLQLTGTLVEGVFSGATMAEAYNLGLLNVGSNVIPIDIESTIHASNTVEAVVVDTQSDSVVVTITDPDGVPGSGDENRNGAHGHRRVAGYDVDPDGRQCRVLPGHVHCHDLPSRGLRRSGHRALRAGSPTGDGQSYTPRIPTTFEFLPAVCAGDADCDSQWLDCSNPAVCVNTQCQARTPWGVGTACTDGGSVCDGEGQCVECNSEMDCASYPGHPYCVSSSCVECLEDSDCSSVPNTPFCVASSCRQCTDDEDCTSAGLGVACGAGRCIECQGDADCPTIECRESPRCLFDDCYWGGPEPAGTACDGGDGTCNGTGTCETLSSISIAPGTIDHVAGDGNGQDGGPAATARVNPRGLAAVEGGLLFADQGFEQHPIHRLQQRAHP